MNEQFEAIENLDTLAELGVANDLRTLLTAAASLGAVQHLQKEARTSEGRLAIAKRTLTLARMPIDPRFENPRDTPLAIYLWLIQDEPALARAIAILLLSRPQLWWARRIAQQVIGEERRSAGATATASYVVGTGRVRSLDSTASEQLLIVPVEPRAELVRGEQINDGASSASGKHIGPLRYVTNQPGVAA